MLCLHSVTDGGGYPLENEEESYVIIGVRFSKHAPKVREAPSPQGN